MSKRGHCCDYCKVAVAYRRSADSAWMCAHCRRERRCRNFRPLAEVVRERVAAAQRAEQLTADDLSITFTALEEKP